MPHAQPLAEEELRRPHPHRRVNLAKPSRARAASTAAIGLAAHGLHCPPQRAPTRCLGRASERRDAARARSAGVRPVSLPPLPRAGAHAAAAHRLRRLGSAGAARPHWSAERDGADGEACRRLADPKRASAIASGGDGRDAPAARAGVERRGVAKVRLKARGTSLPHAVRRRGGIQPRKLQSQHALNPGREVRAHAAAPEREARARAANGRDRVTALHCVAVCACRVSP